MGTAQADRPLDVSNAQVFDYSGEVLVELHGRTADGEFEVVSYAFTPADDDETRLRSPDIPSAHEDPVRETLAEEGYELGAGD